MLYQNSVAITKMIPASVLHTKAKRAREVVCQPERTPADVLKSILLDSGSNNSSSSSSSNISSSSSRYDVTFTKPSAADIAAYDLETVQAVRAGNIDRLRQLWVDGKSMSACNQFGESLLHMACRRGDLTTVKFLISEGKVNAARCDDFGRNPFHDALWTSKPNFEVVDVLIEAAHPHLLLAKDVRGNPPFAYARSEHNAKWVSFLEQRSELLRRNRDAVCASSSSSSSDAPSPSSAAPAPSTLSPSTSAPSTTTPTILKDEGTSQE